MKKVIFFSLFLLLLSMTVFAQDGYYIINQHSDNSQDAVISWVTDLSTIVARDSTKIELDSNINLSDYGRSDDLVLLAISLTAKKSDDVVIQKDISETKVFVYFKGIIPYQGEMRKIKTLSAKRENKVIYFHKKEEFDLMTEIFWWAMISWVLLLISAIFTYFIKKDNEINIIFAFVAIFAIFVAIVATFAAFAAFATFAAFAAFAASVIAIVIAAFAAFAATEKSFIATKISLFIAISLVVIRWVMIFS